MIRKLLRRFFHKTLGHNWRTTHTNQWQIDTRQVCKGCGMVRTVQGQPVVSQWGINVIDHWWVYSDGTMEPDERVFMHTGINPQFNQGRWIDDN